MVGGLPNRAGRTILLGAAPHSGRARNARESEDAEIGEDMKRKTRRRPRVTKRHARGQIVRIDSDASRTHAWQARWSLRRGVHPWGGESPRYRSRIFSDKMFGGSAKALKAAHRWLAAQAKGAGGGAGTKRKKRR